MSNSAQFRDPLLAQKLQHSISEVARSLGCVNLMEVCGTHTMEIARLGLRSLLPANVNLVSGPGCPVCVTPAPYIDALVDLATNKHVTVVTFGDMVRVPGKGRTLAQAKAAGANVEVATSPMGALEIARSNPALTVVFASVGFETTQPACARAVQLAFDEGLKNCKFLVSHHTVPPALLALVDDPLLNIAGFILPGHASVILGTNSYNFLKKRNVPGVVTGFDALDILGGILRLLQLIAMQSGNVVNEYTRAVTADGNLLARDLIALVYEPCDVLWRGIGVIPGSGLRLREKFAAFDAARHFGIDFQSDTEMPDGCSCGSVLKGLMRPPQCPLFGSSCTPAHPVGPCMVSSEGSCAASYKYGEA